VLQRAYSLVTVKGFDPERRTFGGTATSPVPDRLGDTIASDGIAFKNPLPLLLYHDNKKPVGEAKFGRPGKDGTPFDAVISSIDRPGVVADRLQEAVDSLSAKPPLIRGVSIGFLPLEQPTFNKETGGYHYPSIEVYELSMVVIPAHQDATIATLKSLDVGLAAPGTQAVRLHPSGASDPSRTVKLRSDTSMKKSFADQIADWEKTRAAKAARQEGIQQKASEEGRGKDDAEKEEFSTLDSEIANIDEELVDLRKLEAREKATAAPVGGRTPHEGAQGRTGMVMVEKKLPPGIAFARYAMCMGMARGDEYRAKQIAQDNYGDDAHGLIKLIDLQQKAAVGAANTQTAGWASELIPYTIMDDFIEFLRPGTILGKFGTTVNGVSYPNLRRVPFNTRVSGFSAGLTANWIGEGLPILLSKATSFTTSLAWSKLGALAVLTKEEIRFSNPSAEAKVRDELARAMIAKQDLDFINPAKAAVANVSPASITWNTTPVLTTGATAAALRTDLATLIATFGTANFDPSDIVLIMNTVDALNISLMITTLGNPVFPGLTMAGGNLLGFPVITTTAMTGIGSPVSNIIVAVKASEIYLADDGVVTVDASDQASVEMVDASSQTGITGTGASLVSFWQAGLLGLKATREINWKLRRTGAARYIYNSLYKA
jgi:HK97 family phage major capsid protein